MDLKGKNVLLIGLAKTGISTIKLLDKLEANITVNDIKTEEKLADILEELKDIKVMFSRRYDLYKFKHIEELENYLKEMVIVICSGKENTKKKSKIVEEIVHYAENNYYKSFYT